MKTGLENFLGSQSQLKKIKGKRVGLVCHPASVDSKLNHSLDLLAHKIKISCAFGPQHGVRGDKQDNMIESEDFIDPVHGIPVFSLYGKVRRPTDDMMAHFDVLFFDLQDLGCRIYTFATTLLYLMEACTRHQKKFIVLDRPNPAGRVVEGLRLVTGWESFVGAAPMPMRHGLTVGELALYYKSFFKLDLDLEVVKMSGYKVNQKPGYGWPVDRAWINPSPNAATLNMARVYPGSVLLEGTTLSEGRGTTRALEVMGAPDIDFQNVLKSARKMKAAWLEGAAMRLCSFEPTFHKHVGKLCQGIQWHTDLPSYRHNQFKPFRAVALILKSIKKLFPDYPLFRDFAYEYVTDKKAFDVINGGPFLREWIEDAAALPGDLEKKLVQDEKSWAKEIAGWGLY